MARDGESDTRLRKRGRERMIRARDMYHGGRRLLTTASAAGTRHWLRLTWRRKARLYCVGTAKSGTHSIAAMFGPDVRAAHEPESKMVIRKVLACYRGQISGSELEARVRRRDRRLLLDIDSSQLNVFLLHALLAGFPDTRFLLTIRDCYSWLDSVAKATHSAVPVPSWRPLSWRRMPGGARLSPPTQTIPRPSCHQGFGD